MAPEDFKSFWQETAAEALAAPLDFTIAPTFAPRTATHLVREFSFRSISGLTLHGWFAWPDGTSRNRAFVWIPPYGRESKLPDGYGTREDFCSLSFNFFGESAFHQEVYRRERGYFAEGAESPETWVFRRMFQDSLIATRVLQALPEADENRLGVMGMSQGGGIAIWNGAWNPLITAVCADMPFLGDINESLQRHVYRYPLKELFDFAESIPVGKEIVQNTVQYFDTASHAAFAKVPIAVSLGMKDPACKPATVQKIFENIPIEKDLAILDWGHDWHPDMIVRNRNWLKKVMP